MSKNLPDIIVAQNLSMSYKRVAFTFLVYLVLVYHSF